MFPFYKMLFMNRLEFSCFVDFFVRIFKPFNSRTGQADTVVNQYTYLALKIQFVVTFIADYGRIDSYTLIHIFKPIHAHIDRPVQAYIYMLIQSYVDSHI